MYSPEAYRADITYGTNNEFGFDYLRDNMVRETDQLRQRNNFAIVDEVDSILIDEPERRLLVALQAPQVAKPTQICSRCIAAKATALHWDEKINELF